MSYLGNSPGVASQRTTTTITATSNQTVFTTISGYTIGYLDAYLNGSLLVNGDDYTATNGTSITLAQAATQDDIIHLVSYTPRGLTDGYTKTESDAKFLTSSSPVTLKITSIAVTNSSYTVLDDTAVDTGGGYIKITGTGFASGCQVVIGNTVATSVSFISSTEVRCQVPAQTAGSYTVYLTNSDGSVAIRVNGLNYSGVPAWSTTSPLPQQVKNTSINLQLNSSSNSNITYSLQAGSTLPSGITLSSSGLLSGTTPNVANETIYNFTIVATDQENQDTSRAFQITIIAADPYYYLTALHLPGTVTSGLTTTFLSDTSTNNFLVTPNGDVSPRPFSPYFGGNYSVFFDGSGTRLSASNNTAFAFPGDFTIEAWVYLTSASGLKTIFSNRLNGGTSTGITWLTQSGSQALSIFTGGAFAITSSISIPLNTWTHVALTRSGSTITQWVNGQSGNAGTNSSNFSDGNCFIGANDGVAENWPGYISNFRIVKGTAVYTSNFTPPTQPLQNITNTSLLTCQSNRFIDNGTANSGSGFTITTSGTPRVTDNSPFASTDFTTGAGYFDGNGDYLTGVSNTATAFNFTGDFTVECWAYFTSVSTAGQGLVTWADSGGWNGWQVINDAGTIKFEFLAASSAAATVTGGTVVNNQWYHLAVVRNGSGSNNVVIYINGSSSGSPATYTGTQGTSASSYIRVGVDRTSNNEVVGYVSGVRVVKGAAVYSGNFTPPALGLLGTSGASSAAAYPSTTNVNTTFAESATSLLTLQTRAASQNSAFIDSSPNNFVITRNGNTTQGTFSPFVTSEWSNYFDGTSFLRTATDGNLSIGTQDFTLECWFYANSNNAFAGSFVQQYSGDYGMNCYPQGFYYKRDNSYEFSCNAAAVPSLNAWHHWALSRSGTTVAFFLDGVRQATTTIISALNIFSSRISIGDYGAGGGDGTQYRSNYPGYIKDFRLVIGRTIYDVTTTSFAVPTAALTAVANTKLLTCQSRTFTDNGPYAISVLNGIGSTFRVANFAPFAPTASYTTSVNGGSAYFDGTGDWLYTGTGLASPASSDFIIEMWLYPTSFSSTSYPLFTTNNGSKSDVIALELNTSGSLLVYITGTSTWSISSATVGSIVLNQWTHIALTRSGTSFKTYINGKYIQGAVTSSAAVGSSFNGFNIGQSGASTGYFTGYMSNIRYAVGTAITGDFTPASAPLASTTGTQLLLNFTNTGIFDATGKNILETAGNAHISTSVSKFGGGSIRFNGVSNTALRLAANNILSPFTGDYTYEFWVYFNSFAGTPVIFETRRVNGTNPGLQLYCSTGGVLALYGDATTGTLLITGATLSTGQWYHIALVRSGLGSNNTKLYLNGTQTGSSATDTTSYNNQGGTIGSHTANDNNFLNGYINDFRITRYARYTTSFTPPASLVPLQ